MQFVLTQAPSFAQITSTINGVTVTLPDDTDIEVTLVTLPDGKQKIHLKLISNTAITSVPNEGEIDLTTLPPGTRFHTWAKKETIQRWVDHHGPDQSEIDYLMKNGLGTAGGGFYTSLDPIDSIAFGDTAIFFQSDEPIKAVNGKVTSPVYLIDPLYKLIRLNSNLSNKLNQKLYQNGIAGTLYNDDWLVIYSAAALKHGHQATQSDLLQELDSQKITLSNITDLGFKIKFEPNFELQQKLPIVYKILSTLLPGAS